MAEKTCKLMGRCSWRAGLLITVPWLAIHVSMVASADITERVFIPNFWDPQHRLEKPDLTGLRGIRFLTEDDYPPFHFALPDGSLAGFDVDLARAICEELKLTCTIQARRWDTLIDSLAEGRGDALVASIAITAQTRAKVDFTTAYYTTPARFVMQAATRLDTTTPEGLAGKRIGVQAKSAHEAYLRTFFAKSTLVSFDSQTALRAALLRGEVDAVFGDGIAFSLWLNGTDAKGCCVFVGGPYTESRFFGEGVGIAVKKNDTQLRRVLDYALATLAERGIYADLYLKYFPIGFY